MDHYAAFSDHQLAELLQTGDKMAFNEIYRRYWDTLFNAAYKRLPVLESCEEIIQDVFVYVWERRDVIRINTGLSNYLRTAVKYRIIDHYRRKLSEDAWLDTAHAGNSMDNSTEEQIILNDLTRHLEVLIEKLPQKCRSVYRLSRHDHKTNKEIAELLGISEKTVEWHLTKALQTLRQGLAAYLVITLIIFF